MEIQSDVPKFDADGLTTFHYAPFYSDQRFSSAYAKAIYPLRPEDADVRYRGYIIQWAVSQVRELAGDFVECGTYNAKVATLILNLEDLRGKKRKFHLFDTFSGIPAEMLTQREQDLGFAGQFSDVSLAEVMEKLKDYRDIVEFHKGVIPDSFQGFFPGRVAFLHLDLNGAKATQAALHLFYPALVQGAVVLFDDYGWDGYEDQRKVVDLFFADKKEETLALPTGQGMVIRKSHSRA
ncbi:MAG: TylF/MycF/NovP-related O-methyltransferase [Thermodesulfobacteriota bacterium]|nr:TylF/MycF/NovP-related O-methyltransferase [Thermodesulfobacteriota bacterium]